MMCIYGNKFDCKLLLKGVAVCCKEGFTKEGQRVGDVHSSASVF